MPMIFRKDESDDSIALVCDWFYLGLKVVVVIAGCNQLATWICDFILSVSGVIGNHSLFRGTLIFMFIWVLIAPFNQRKDMIFGWIFLWLLLIAAILFCVLDPLIFN